MQWYDTNRNVCRSTPPITHHPKCLPLPSNVNYIGNGMHLLGEWHTTRKIEPHTCLCFKSALALLESSNQVFDLFLGIYINLGICTKKNCLLDTSIVSTNRDTHNHNKHDTCQYESTSMLNNVREQL